MFALGLLRTMCRTLCASSPYLSVDQGPSFSAKSFVPSPTIPLSASTSLKMPTEAVQPGAAGEEQGGITVRTGH